jgi:hypothetical protein
MIASPVGLPRRSPYRAKAAAPKDRSAEPSRSRTHRCQRVASRRSMPASRVSPAIFSHDLYVRSALGSSQSAPGLALRPLRAARGELFFVRASRVQDLSRATLRKIAAALRATFGEHGQFPQFRAQEALRTSRAQAASATRRWRCYEQLRLERQSLVGAR